MKNSIEVLEQEYKKSVIQSGIKAAKLLGEIMDTKNISDSHTKDIADVALKLIESINSASDEIFDYYEDDEDED